MHVASIVASDSRVRHWLAWCNDHPMCLKRHPWTVRRNPRIRHERWKAWCLKRSHCANRYHLIPKLLPETISGPVGREILGLPEGAYVRTFLSYGSLARYLMGIGLEESGGGESGAYFMGCLDGSGGTYWPEQIGCANRVLSAGIASCGSLYAALGYYNAGSCDGNAAYSDAVLSFAAGIQVVR